MGTLGTSAYLEQQEEASPMASALFVCLFESERNIHLFFYLFMHSLVDSCMCPGRGLNPQPWRMVTML